MRDRDDDAASRKHVGRVAGIARRGVQAEGVLDAHVGRTELGQIAEDAVIFGHVSHFHDSYATVRSGDTYERWPSRPLPPPSWLSGSDRNQSAAIASAHELGRGVRASLRRVV